MASGTSSSTSARRRGRAVAARGGAIPVAGITRRQKEGGWPARREKHHRRQAQKVEAPRTAGAKDGSNSARSGAFARNRAFKVAIAPRRGFCPRALQRAIGHPIVARCSELALCYKNRLSPTKITHLHSLTMVKFSSKSGQKVQPGRNRDLKSSISGKTINFDPFVTAIFSTSTLLRPPTSTSSHLQPRPQPRTGCGPYPPLQSLRDRHPFNLGPFATAPLNLESLATMSLNLEPLATTRSPASTRLQPPHTTANKTSRSKAARLREGS